MKRQLAANTFGAIGYLVTLLSWLWSLILLLTGTKILETLEENRDTAPPTVLKLPEFSLPEPIVIILAAGLVLSMIALSIYAVYKTPATAVKASSRTLHKSADKALVVIQRHQPLPTEKRRLLTDRFVFYGKLALILMPVIILAILILLAPSDMKLAPDLAIIVSTSISLLALLLFAGQYGLARLLKVPPKDLL